MRATLTARPPETSGRGFSSAGSFSAVCLALILTPFGLSSATAQEEVEAPKTALLVTVPTQLTGEAVNRIRSTVEMGVNRERDSIRTVVFDFNPDGRPASTRDYGICYELAKFIREQSLNGVRTIAFVRAETTRHSVLPVLACTEVVMGRDGAIGAIVAQDAPVPPRTEQDYYVDLAGQSRAGLVLKMLDPAVVVARGRRDDGSEQYIDMRHRNRYPDLVGLEEVIPAGAIEMYDTSKALNYGLAQSRRESPRELAEAYNLVLEEDQLQGRLPMAWQIVVRGKIDRSAKATLERRIRNAISEGGNILFLQLECSGGDPYVARNLADTLRELTDLEGRPVLTVAYIQDKAPDTAAIVALGCDEIVMVRANEEAGRPGSEIGDFTDLLMALASRPGRFDQGVEQLRKNMADLADKAGYPPAIFEGMVDPKMTVIRVRAKDDPTKRTYLSKEQYEIEQEQWINEGTIKEPDELIRLSATEARQMGIARHLIDSPNIREVYPLYGLESSQIKEATPDWLDAVARTLRQPFVAALLVMIGIACLIIELKIPGFGISGVIAALCFVLFFWSQSQLSGQIIWLALLLFLLGLALVLVEIFLVPGTMVSGFSGVALLITGLVLAGLETMPSSSSEWNSLGERALIFGVSIIMAAIGAVIFARYLPNIPVANRMLLAPPEDDPTEVDAALPGAETAMSLLGAIGVASTMLRPAGTARFDDRYIDVVTEGSFIPAGTRIQVIEVEGNRIVVKEI